MSANLQEDVRRSAFGKGKVLVPVYAAAVNPVE